MEVVFPLHAAWVWNNYFFSLSLSPSFFPSLPVPSLVFAVLWRSSTLFFWDCAPLCLHPLNYTVTPASSYSSSPLRPFPFSSALSVVYQDGFYGAADLYVSKLNLPSDTPSLSIPSRLSPALFSSGGDSACASSHALHRAACVKVNEPTTRSCLETQRTTCNKLTEDSFTIKDIFCLRIIFCCDKNISYYTIWTQLGSK